MNIFINSASVISPIHSFDNDKVEWIEPNLELPWLKCVEPIYKQYISPGKLRRMARVVRMGVATGLTALKTAEIESPDAIIMGTGLGCVLDTEKFLEQIIENDESLLNPTAFIQSTHNTVSGQIALLLGCHSYNFTFTQKDISFESALLESIMMINDGEANNALVGAVDEMTENTYKLLQKAGCSDTEKGVGFVAGEASAFFVLSKQPSEKSIAQVKGVSIRYNIDNNNDLNAFISAFMKEHDVKADESTTLLIGDNETPADQKWHATIRENFAEASQIVNFKKYCGENDAASSFAFWMGSEQFKNENVQNVIIYNTNQGASHSLIMLSRC